MQPPRTCKRTGVTKKRTCWIFPRNFSWSFQQGCLPESLISLLVISKHIKEGLQQSVISVLVWLGSVEAVAVVTKQAAVRTPVPVQLIQGLVQLLRRDPFVQRDLGRSSHRARRNRRALPVKGRLEEAKERQIGIGEARALGWIFCGKVRGRDRRKGV